MTTGNNEVQDVTVSIETLESKVRCLKFIDEVAETGRDVIVSKNGLPVSRLVPHHDRVPHHERMSYSQH